ncbi:hypothetical protein F7734_04990 [Scytonema sp. UIC 10036]|uniref:effector-associated domain EAD1-containing protein n=1 Tax=Scytonema sp. UIC 10036 TaxID=2304196 RepID=UPI0012DA9100|nr:effector-associated domain EAD1-containing protein [Scytonema sp. UIC 10036]MUG91862.1 hypothetical protein [Scytonema sp. UIC 10036]
MTHLRILLVEDDPNWQKILDSKIHSALEGIGHSEDTIKLVKTFAEAYDILQKSHWHLLVTDIGLKDSSISRRQKLGVQLVELASQQRIPVIVVSGTPVVNTQDIRDFFKEHDVSDYFKKGTFDNKNFIKAVQAVLQKQLQTLSTTKEIFHTFHGDLNQQYTIKLFGEQRKKLQEALIHAFPSLALLEQMLSFELNKNLDTIAAKNDLKDVVFNLIKTAEAQGWVEELVRAARESNPGNLSLQAIAQELLPNHQVTPSVKDKF